MEYVAYWLTLGAVLWFSMPALAARRQRVLGVLLAVVLPLFSWAWLVWIAIQHRTRAVEAAPGVDEKDERERLARDVEFWRDRARTGTPAEREAARMYLESIGRSVQPGPSEEYAAELGAATWLDLDNLRRHYERVTTSADDPEVVRSASGKLTAVRLEMQRRLTRELNGPVKPARIIAVPQVDPEAVREFARRYLR